MKPTPVIHDGATIGWVIPAKDETGFYASHGARLGKKLFGSKHATASSAEAAIRKAHAALMKSVEVI